MRKSYMTLGLAASALLLSQTALAGTVITNPGNNASPFQKGPSASAIETPVATVQPTAIPQSANIPAANAGTANYVSGGIGMGERARLEAAEAQYNLKVETAYDTGHYVSDAVINVKDKSGNTVINAVADGPLFYANLPAGAYTVEVNYKDEVKTRKVNLVTANGTAKPNRLMFVWKDPEPHTES